MTAQFRQVKKIVSTFLVAGFVILLAAPVMALQLNSATYSLSRQKISEAADHDLRFQTPTGVDAPTDTIILTYPSGFSLAGIALGDIDFFHGATTGLETEETLGAAAAAGIWGVSIAASSVTFTAPTNAVAGEIPANDFVVIRIGTNAAGGTGQIVNPATAQVANMTVDGTFGDSAMIGTSIIAEDGVAVSANIPSTTPPQPPPQPPPSPGPGDIFPPIISNVQVINITSSTADVIWDTDESSTSYVDYGLTVAYGTQVANASFVKKHSVSLSQLSASTTYHFQVSSKDGANNLGVSGDYTFTTLGDTTPPQIFNVQVINITDTSAQVIWNTDEPADSLVDYGTSTNYGKAVSAPSFITAHLLQLSNLKPNTLYHFFVTSKDQSNNQAVSGDATFITSPDLTPPSNVINFKAVGGDAVVHLSWIAPADPDYSGTRIVRRIDKFPSGPTDGTLIYDGTLQLVDDKAVTNGTTYYYGAFAYDTSLNFASGALASATPQGVILPAENTIPLCSNGIDDDGDTKVDCADSDCAAFQICKPPQLPTPENTNPSCSNGIDDDLDGAIDCADTECQALPLCITKPPQPPPVPPTISTQPVPTPQGVIIEINPHFYGADGTVELMPDQENKMGALSGSAVYVYLPIADLGVEVEKAYIVGSLYHMSLSKNGTAYEATITVPADGLYNIAVIAEIKGGGTAVASRQFMIQEYGRVVEENLTGQSKQGIAAAEVTLFVDQGGWVQWNAAIYAQSNPQLTNSDGYYAFIVPNGRYYVQVKKDGYSNFVSVPVNVFHNVVNIKAGLVKVPPSLIEVVTTTEPTLEGLGNLAKNISDQVLFGLTTMRAALQRPDVQDVVENTVSPALLAISLINLAAALPIFNA
ncbi:hypothetical protein KKG24_05365, partial [Patescibacteria group bacterium]|nr:hypothetical protein [Patescibacteria group bacterium]